MSRLRPPAAWTGHLEPLQRSSCSFKTHIICSLILQKDNKPRGKFIILPHVVEFIFKMQFGFISYVCICFICCFASEKQTVGLILYLAKPPTSPQGQSGGTTTFLPMSVCDCKALSPGGPWCHQGCCCLQPALGSPFSSGCSRASARQRLTATSQVCTTASDRAQIQACDSLPLALRCTTGYSQISS